MRLGGAVGGTTIGHVKGSDMKASIRYKAAS